MSADLHIHIRTENLTEEDFAKFFSSTLGSKYFGTHPGSTKFEEKIYVKMSNAPNIWVGSVSWLKAALTGDAETYVPSTVDTINKLIGEDQPEITDELIEKIMQAFELPNNTVKEGGVWDGKGYALANPKDMRAFLEHHKGKRVFTISW